MAGADLIVVRTACSDRTCLPPCKCSAPPPGLAIDGRTSDGLTPSPDALALMRDRVAAIRAGTAGELFWFAEHPPIYTAGTSAKPDELTEPTRFPAYKAGRGGQWTYHGP